MVLRKTSKTMRGGGGRHGPDQGVPVLEIVARQATDITGEIYLRED